MSTINSNYVSDYFKARPQLKRPKCNFGMYEIPEEWFHLVTGLIAIAEQKNNKKLNTDASLRQPGEGYGNCNCGQEGCCQCDPW